MNSRMVFLLVYSWLLMAVSCTKKDIPPPLLQDGPMSATLGKLIYLPNHSGSRSEPVWGKNADELFFTTAMQVVRVDLAALKVDVLESEGGLITGSNNEHSAVIFLGTINGQYGYYQYTYSTGKIEEIMAVAADQQTLLNIAGANVFYFTEKTSPPAPPCTGFCWINYYGQGPPGQFYHFNKTTGTQTQLQNKLFYRFSQDGSKTILSNAGTASLFLYDNASRQITDSLPYPVQAQLYFDDALKSFIISPAGEIIIKTTITGQTLHQFHPQLTDVNAIKLSADGSRIYYTGTSANGNKGIAVYNLLTKQEKIVISTPAGLGRFVLSGDNKKIVLEDGAELYVKTLD